MNTHGLICDFGCWRGVRYTRLPVSYLKWMVNVRHSRAGIAEAELARRGTVTPELEVTGHALDRASLRCLDLWASTRRDGEGLHAWLCRMAAEALAANVAGDQRRLQYAGIKFVFGWGGVWPVLKTVMPAGRREP
ncbi:MAG: hypothetical protein JNM60_11250 [Candidatus Competibacteraceae bacterium]|nr:hypothetical protein [Candidatus Competibacteraceae bacterium]